MNTIHIPRYGTSHVPLRKMFQISGVAGGQLVDPFLGAGTSELLAIVGAMNFACNGIETKNSIMISERVRSELKGGIQW
jgi:hypothetical protein